jgi:hypothetical protein
MLCTCALGSRPTQTDRSSYSTWLLELLMRIYKLQYLKNDLAYSFISIRDP